MSVMSTTFIALAYNITFLRERGILKRVRGTPLPTVGLPGRASPATRSPTPCCRSAIVIVAGHAALRLAWPQRLVRAGRVRRRSASSASRSLGVALSHAIPNFESAPAYVNAVFLPADLASPASSTTPTTRRRVLRDIAEALPLKHLIDGLSGAMVTGEGVGHHLVALLVLGAVGRGRARRSPSAASPGSRAPEAAQLDSAAALADVQHPVGAAAAAAGRA